MDEKFLEKKIEDLDFSVRTFNILKRMGCQTAGDVVRLGEDKIKRARNSGIKVLDEVKGKLALYGVELQEPQVDKDILAGLEKGGLDYLKNLPDKYFAEKSREFSLVGETVAKYLKTLAAEGSKTAENQADFDRVEKEITAKMAEYKDLVEQKRAEYNSRWERMEFMGKMTAKIDEVRHYHHTPTHKTYEGHDHNPFSNEKEL